MSFYGDLDGPPIDLFVIYPFNKTTDYLTVFDFEWLQAQYNLYPSISEICSGDLLGVLVRVPCNAEALLRVSVVSSFKVITRLSMGRNGALITQPVTTLISKLITWRLSRTIRKESLPKSLLNTM
jgi:hypothetical protein